MTYRPWGPSRLSGRYLQSIVDEGGSSELANISPWQLQSSTSLTIYDSAQAYLWVFDLEIKEELLPPTKRQVKDFLTSQLLSPSHTRTPKNASNAFEMFAESAPLATSQSAVPTRNLNLAHQQKLQLLCKKHPVSREDSGCPQVWVGCD